MKRSVLFGVAALGALGLVAAAVAQTAAPPAAAPAAGLPPGADAVYAPSPLATTAPRHFVVKGIRGGHPMDEETIKLIEQDRVLGAQVADAATEFRSATEDAQRTELQQKIAALVAQQFDLRQSMRERELEELSAQIVRLRTLHDQRTAQKERIVVDRVNQVMRDAQGLGWGDDSAGVGSALKFKWQGAGDWELPPGDPNELARRKYVSDSAGNSLLFESSSDDLALPAKK